MKKSILALSLALFSMILFLGFNFPEEHEKAVEAHKASKVKIPDDIQPIIKKSCFGCHNSNSRNEKAKTKLQFDQLEHMKKKEAVAILGKIYEEVKKGDMPPPKFLEHFTDAKPTDEEVQKILTWTHDDAMKMMKKKKKDKDKNKDNDMDHNKSSM